MTYVAFTNSKYLLEEDILQCKMWNILSFSLQYRSSGNTLWYAQALSICPSDWQIFAHLSSVKSSAEQDQFSRGHQDLQDSVSDGESVQSPQNPHVGPDRGPSLGRQNERLGLVSSQVLGYLCSLHWGSVGTKVWRFQQPSLWGIRLHWKKQRIPQISYRELWIHWTYLRWGWVSNP